MFVLSVVHSFELHDNARTSSSYSGLSSYNSVKSLPNHSPGKDHRTVQITAVVRIKYKHA